MRPKPVVRRLSLLLVMSAIVQFASLSDAGMLFLEGGRGFYFSNDATVFAIRGRIDCADLFALKSFCEAEYVSWNGKNENEAYGLARGIRWKAGARGFGTLSAGLSRIDRTSSTLGQPFEFIGRLAYERPAGAALLSFGWTHISDAKFIFQWPGRNDGENFLTLSAGLPF